MATTGLSPSHTSAHKVDAKKADNLTSSWMKLPWHKNVIRAVDIVSVQPMTEPVGGIKFYKQYLGNKLPEMVQLDLFPEH